MQPDKIVKQFQRSIHTTRSLLAKQRNFYEKGNILQREIDAIYELCFLNIFISFEQCTVSLLKANMLLEQGSDGKRRSLMRPQNLPSAERFLKGTNSFIPAMPIDSLLKTAKVYLKDGKPFSLIEKPKKREAERAYIIRNHIAHRSIESTSKFKTQILENAALTRKVSAPGFYLRSQMTATATYFDHHTLELGSLLRFWCDQT